MSSRPVALTPRWPLAAALAGVIVLTGACQPSVDPMPPKVADSSPATTRKPTRPKSSKAPTATTLATSHIASARWIRRAGERTLEVIPTDTGRRSLVVSEEDIWQELVTRVPGADTPGMRNQLICHVHFAPTKKAWYLEPRRPDVGYAETVAARCNPGAVHDPDQ